MELEYSGFPAAGGYVGASITAHEKRLMLRFGERLRALRIAAGFEDAEVFANELGLKAQRYRRYERGETVPPLAVQELMVKILDKPLGFIMLGHPHKPGK